MRSGCITKPVMPSRTAAIPQAFAIAEHSHSVSGWAGREQLSGCTRPADLGSRPKLVAVRPSAIEAHSFL
jgi:hypothetical protein